MCWNIDEAFWPGPDYDFGSERKVQMDPARPGFTLTETGNFQRFVYNTRSDYVEGIMPGEKIQVYNGWGDLNFTGFIASVEARVDGTEIEYTIELTNKEPMPL